jgi:hypothetical protein
MQELEEKRELSSIERLARREARTNDDGTVEVEVFDWHEADGEVTVEFLTPINDKKSETMAFPQAGAALTDYKFYRLLQDCGLSVRNAELLEGRSLRARVKRNANDETWTLEPAGPEPSRLSRLAEFVINVAEEFKNAPLLEYTIGTLWVATILVLLVSVVVMVL